MSVHELRIYSHNVQRNYGFTEVLLENLKDSCDVLFIQEPPWNLIRRAFSSSDKEGEKVVGPPLHPDWVVLFPRIKNAADHPRVMTYVNRQLSAMRPAYRSDLCLSNDIMVLSLRGSEELLLMNVYSDREGTAIKWLSDHGGALPRLFYMGGDFNCHSDVWDPGCARMDRSRSNSLLLFAEEQGLELSLGDEDGPVPTHYPHARALRPLVIDLMFIRHELSCWCVRAVHHTECGPSDHAPLTIVLLVRPIRGELGPDRIAPDSEEEVGFLMDLEGLIFSEMSSLPLESSQDVQRMSEVFSGVSDIAWTRWSRPSRPNPRSNSWW